MSGLGVRAQHRVGISEWISREHSRPCRQCRRAAGAATPTPADLVGTHGNLDAASGIQPAYRGCQEHLDGAGGDEQTVGDLATGASVGHERQYFFLRGGERFNWLPGSELNCCWSPLPGNGRPMRMAMIVTVSLPGSVW